MAVLRRCEVEHRRVTAVKYIEPPHFRKFIPYPSGASLYGLLNFFREYVPTFAGLTEPLRSLLGQDASPWTQEAEDAIRTMADRIV